MVQYRVNQFYHIVEARVDDSADDPGVILRCIDLSLVGSGNLIFHVRLGPSSVPHFTVEVCMYIESGDYNAGLIYLGTENDGSHKFRIAYDSDGQTFGGAGHIAKTGLTEACRKSQVTLADAENSLHAYICGHSSRSDTLYMAGNSVYGDKAFIDKYMPKVGKMHHYRLVDVSAVKTLAAHWYPNEAHTCIKAKRLTHRALEDIQDSIEELRGYRRLIFK